MKFFRLEALSPAGWWRLRKVDLAWPSAVRAMIGANIVLVAAAVTGHAELVPAAAFGGMTAVHARFEPFPIRAKVLAAVGAGLTISVGLGAMAAAAGWGTLWTVALVAVVAAAAKLLTDAIRSGPPGGLIFVFAVGTMALLPMEWTEVRAQVAIAAAGSAVAWLIGMAGWLIDPLGPVRLAVARPGSRGGEQSEW